jgi:type II secretory pathway pseudopilin PulG
MNSTFSNQRGVSLIEASIILSVVAILSAIMAPSINGYVERARQARAREDVKTIAEAIQAFITDTAEHFFLLTGNGTSPTPPSHADGQRVNLLVSDGDIPSLGSTVSAETFWTTAINGTTVDTLANHLTENNPGETTASRYRNPTDMLVASPGGNNPDFARSESSSFNAPYAWRGPYLQAPIDPDPWGNRYAVNVGFLKATVTATAISNISSAPGGGSFSAALDYPRLDVFVLSAGADEEIDTRSAQDGAVPGDDDFIYLVSSNAK